MKKLTHTVFASLIVWQSLACAGPCLSKERGSSTAGSLKVTEKRSTIGSAKEREKTIEAIVQLLSRFTDSDQTALSNYSTKLMNWPGESGKALIDLLDTNNETVQAKVAWLLRNLAHQPDFWIDRESLKTLIGIAESTTNAEAQVSLVEALGAIGPRDPNVKRAVIAIYNKSNEVHLKRVALDALTSIAKNEKSSEMSNEEFELIAAAIKNPDAPSLRKAAAKAFGQVRGRPEPTIKVLVDALDDNYLEVRQAAVEALRQYGVEAKPAAPKLLAVLKTESDHTIRHSSLHALQAIGMVDQDVAQELISLLDDQEFGTFMLSQLYVLGPFAAPAVPKLIQYLKSPELLLRTYAASNLGYIGPAASEALPALEIATTDSSSTVQTYAKLSIERIKGTRTIPKCVPGM